VVDTFDSWDTLRDAVHATGVPWSERLAAERLLPHLCASATRSSLPGQVITYLLANGVNSDGILDVLAAFSHLIDASVEACGSTVVEMVRRAGEVPPDRWPAFLSGLSSAGEMAGGIAHQLVRLLAEAWQPGDTRPESFAKEFGTLADCLPAAQREALSAVVSSAGARLRESPDYLRTLARVREWEGLAAEELDLLLRVAAAGCPLASREWSRALALLAADQRFSTFDEKMAPVMKLTGDTGDGSGLADALSGLVKDASLKQITAWTEVVISSPDLWVAGWTAWLRANPAITHFQGSLRRNPMWHEALLRSGRASRAAVLDFVPEDVVEAIPELWTAALESLGKSATAVAAVARRLEVGTPLTDEELQCVTAFVAEGPTKLRRHEDLENAWALFSRCAAAAFRKSSAGLRMWLRSLKGGGASITESRLFSLTSALAVAVRDTHFDETVTGLEQLIDSARLPGEVKDRVRQRISAFAL
jgi:hypothetical protein